MKKFLIGGIIGIINGFFGASGGVAAVISLEKTGHDSRKAHAMAVGIILPISVISVVIYLFNGKSDIITSLKTIPFGVAGAFIGGMLLKKINPRLLKILFSVLMVYSGIVLIMR